MTTILMTPTIRTIQMIRTTAMIRAPAGTVRTNTDTVPITTSTTTRRKTTTIIPTTIPSAQTSMRKGISASGTTAIPAGNRRIHPERATLRLLTTRSSRASTSTKRSTRPTPGRSRRKTRNISIPGIPPRRFRTKRDTANGTIPIIATRIRTAHLRPRLPPGGSTPVPGGNEWSGRLDSNQRPPHPQ